MAIAHYLIVLFLMNGTVYDARIQSFDEFATQAGFNSPITCPEFIKSKKRDDLFRSGYGISDFDIKFEPICLTPENYSKWLLSSKKFK